MANKWLSWSKLHCYKEGHFCLVFPKTTYLRLLKYGKELERKMMDEVIFGLNVTLGRDIKQVSFNMGEFDRARYVISRVYSFIDIAFVAAAGKATEPCLQDVGIYVTDDFDFVKPPPFNTPVHHD